MRYSVYIDIDDGSGYQEAFPDFVDKFKITRRIGTDSMEKYFYRVLWGKIQFSNRPKKYAETGSDVYRLFNFIQNINFGFDTEIKIKFVTDNITIFGYFGRNDCTFDYDRKIFTVTPAVKDQYTPILENYEEKINFDELPFEDDTVTVELTNFALRTINDWPYPGYDSDIMVTPRNRIKEKDYDDNGELYLYFEGNAPKTALFEDEYYRFTGYHQDLNAGTLVYYTYSLADRVEILGQTITPENTDTVVFEYGDFELSRFRVYEGTRIGGLSGKRWRQLYCQTWFSRDETLKEDVVDAGNPYGYESPVGEGWNMRKAAKKNGKDAHWWTRKPFNGAYSDDWADLVEVANNSLSEYEWNWYKYVEAQLQYDNTESLFELTTTVKLRDFVEHVIQNTSPDLAGMEFRSTFFFNDFEDEMEVLAGTVGYNYVTGAKNYLNKLRLFFTKDLTDPDPDEIEASPEYTLKELLDDLNKVFVNKLTWFIDDAGYFRIEHVRWVDLNKVPLDVSTNPLLNFTTWWEYDKANMFERYEFAQVNAGYPDFTDNLITFDKIVSNNRNQDLKKSTVTSIISTDARYCILNPNDIKDGLVLIALDDSNTVLNLVGAISNVMETNGYLALSNIIRDFGKYEGMWNVGWVNGNVTYFTVTERNKLGTEIKLDGLKLSVFYKTQIGIGLIDDGTIDFETENTTLELRYRYNSSVNGDMFILAFQKETDFAGALNNWADIDNYTR